MKDIYKLELHESALMKRPNDDMFPQFKVTRVAGGWIYETGAYFNPVFVPFNNEFQIKR